MRVLKSAVHPLADSVAHLLQVAEQTHEREQYRRTHRRAHANELANRPVVHGTRRRGQESRGQI